MMNRDVGDIFLNFIPGYKLRPYCGLDVTHVVSEDNLELEGISYPNWERWEIKIMGLVYLNCYSCQIGIVSREVALGEKERVEKPSTG